MLLIWHHYNILVSRLKKNDIIKVVLDLNRVVSETEPSWNDSVENQNFNFQDFPISKKSCVKHFNLDARQEATFNIFCSSFMLAHLDDSINIPEDQNMMAEEVLQKKGCSEHLVMNLTGAGGCEKSFVLNASKSMCEQFCKVIGQPFNSPFFFCHSSY